MTKLESKFQKELIDELKSRFEGCIVFKMDPTYIQGIPDLLVLFEDKWAMLEAKRTASSSHRPNQDYYIDKLCKMGYAEFVDPSNKDEILNELEHYFNDDLLEYWMDAAD